jgi:hypothetical protein
LWQLLINSAIFIEKRFNHFMKFSISVK